MLFVSDLNELKMFKKHINNKIQLVPILEYKWKLKLFIKKIKEENILKRMGIKEGEQKKKREIRLLKKRIKKSKGSKKKLFRD